MTSSTNPSATGQAVTFTATISPGDGGGTVAFFADGSNTAISGCAVQSLSLVSRSTYQATCATSSLPTGSHPISATYSGDTDFLTSSGSLASNQSVNLTNTTTTVVSSLNPSTVGTSVTFTATISPSDGGGTVDFFADGSNTAISGCESQSLTLVSGSTYQATCSTASLTVANHPIAATYSGDTDFATCSGSLSGGQTVNSASKIDTTTTASIRHDYGIRTDHPAGSHRYACVGHRRSNRHRHLLRLRGQRAWFGDVARGRRVRRSGNHLPRHHPMSVLPSVHGAGGLRR